MGGCYPRRVSRFAALALALAGCYGPTIATNVPCSADLTCPAGQQCDSRGATPVCVELVSGIDADTDAAMIVDGPPDGAAIDAAIDGALPTPIPSGAVLWLRFDDDPSDGAADSAGTHTATCTSCPARVTGLHGMAYDFAAPNLVSIAPAADLEPVANMTFAAWARLDATLTTTGVIGCKNRATQCSYALLSLSGPERAYYYAVGGQVTGSAFSIGSWHHFAVTWDGTTLRGYLDGEPDGERALATMETDAQMPLMIGGKGSTNPLHWNGAIDDVVFYRRVLTQAEITQLATP